MLERALEEAWGTHLAILPEQGPGWSASMTCWMPPHGVRLWRGILGGALLVDLLKTTLALGALVLPGVLCVMLLDRRSSWPAILSLGSALGLSVTTLGGYHALRAGIPFLVFVAAQWLVVLGLAMRAGLAMRVGLSVRAILARRRGPVLDVSQREARSSGGGGWLLAGLLVLVFVSRAVPLFFGDLPLGSDPSFHAIIAQKILLTQAIPTDWQPFEAVALNYPVGTHLLIAEISRAVGLPVHLVFKCMFPIIACLTTLSVHSCALRLLGPQSVIEARLAALCFGFLAIWGSVDLYRWGGLPNALGMLLLPSLAELVWHEQRDLSIGLFAVLFAALVVVHHHAALCAGLLFAGHVVFTTLMARRIVSSSARIITGLAAATVLAILPLMTYLRGGGEVGRTSVLRFYEPLVTIWSGLAQLGWPLVALGALGIVLMTRGAIDERRLFLAWWLALLFGAFVLFGDAWRFAALALDGGFYAAFTPSRFLTNLAQPLAIAAGLALTWLAGFIREGFPRRLALVGVVIGALLFAIPPLREQCEDPDVDVDVAALTWLGAHAEPDAFIVAQSSWAPFFSWRETAFTPLPASEARQSEGVLYKREVLSRDPRALRDFAKSSGRSVYIVIGAATPLQGLKEVYTDERFRIFKLE